MLSTGMANTSPAWTGSISANRALMKGLPSGVVWAAGHGRSRCPFPEDRSEPVLHSDSIQVEDDRPPRSVHHIDDDGGFVELAHICFLEADEFALDELDRGRNETSERGVVEHGFGRPGVPDTRSSSRISNPEPGETLTNMSSAVQVEFGRHRDP